MSSNVCKLTDKNLNFKYNAFQKLIDKPQLDDVPIVIYSISGPTRTGKSYLLNILHYLMRKQQSQVDEDENDEQPIPQWFESKRQPKACTKGIFMTTKPIFMETGGAKIAVFLMDTQGIEAGDKVECKEADLFTISSTLSFMQIVNIKHTIGFPTVDTYAALAFFAARLKIVPKNSNKLMMVVRDWEDPDTHEYGHDGGQAYFESLQNKPGWKRQFQSLRNYFRTLDSYLVPHPGNIVATTNSKLKCDMDPQTWMSINNLYKLLFSQDNIQNAFKTMLKGKDFLRLAESMNDILAPEVRPLLPEGSFKSYLDVVMKTEVSQCVKRYKQTMMPHAKLEEKELSSKHKKTQEQEIEQLQNNSVCDVSEYKTLLLDCINTEFKIVIGRRLLLTFAIEWAKNIKKKGNFSIQEITDFFRKEGEKYKKEFKSRFEDDAVYEVVTHQFIAVLGRLFELEVQRRNKNKQIAITCVAGAFGLLAGGAFAFFAPIILAGSAALTVGGGAAAGGSVTAGTLSAITSNFTKKNPSPPDLNEGQSLGKIDNLCAEELNSIIEDIQNKLRNE